MHRKIKGLLSLTLACVMVTVAAAPVLAEEPIEEQPVIELVETQVETAEPVQEQNEAEQPTTEIALTEEQPVEEAPEEVQISEEILLMQPAIQQFNVQTAEIDDTDAPVITVEQTGEILKNTREPYRYYGGIKLVVTDENLDTVKKNGGPVGVYNNTAYLQLDPPDGTNPNARSERYEISASDKAGNSISCIIQVFPENTSSTEESQVPPSTEEPQAPPSTEEPQTPPSTDTAAPVISGVENGKTYYGSQSVVVTDENLTLVTVNGVTQSISNNSSMFSLNSSEQPYQILAADAAGNQTLITVEVLETWVRDGITTNGKKKLRQAQLYKLGSGQWTVDADTTVYTGGGSFYVKTGGEYDFKKK